MSQFDTADAGQSQAEEGPQLVGPEQRTLVERALGLVPLPYGWAALIVALLLGPPGSLLVAYLETRDLQTSLESFFHGYMPEFYWQQILSVVLWSLFYAILFWVIWYARHSVLRATNSLAPLLSEPREYRAAFRGLSRTGPAVLIGLVLYALFFMDYRLRIIEAPGPVSSVYEALSGPPLYLMSGTAIWVYMRTLGGLHQLGRGDLKLTPFYEDKTMGLRPLAALSLSLSAAFFSLLFIMVLMLLLGPVRTEYVITVSSLLIVGIALFFLPLMGAHRRMKHEKQALRAALRKRWAPLVEAHVPPTGAGALADGEGSAGSPGSHPPVEEQVNMALVLEALERQAAAVQTWPFDIAILGKLGVMVGSILLSLLTQLAARLLGW
jgi:hypothetical protein